MAGNQAPDIGQLIRILTIAIVATLILAAALGAMFVLNIFDNDVDMESSSASSAMAAPSPAESVPAITPTYTRQSSVSYSNEGLNISERTIRMPVDASADDSIEIVESFIPDDPYFSPPEFNNTAADFTLSTEFYKVLYRNDYHFLYNSTSIVVTVGKGPLVIYYEVFDIAVESGTGTGNTLNTGDQYTDETSETIEDLPTEHPYYSFLDIAVTDLSTGETVATGGYGRTYPSIEEQSIKIPMTGEFRVDMYGSGLDVDFAILSGTVPDNPDAVGTDPTMKNKYSFVIEKSSETSETSGTGALPGGPEEMWW